MLYNNFGLDQPKSKVARVDKSADGSRCDTDKVSGNMISIQLASTLGLLVSIAAYNSVLIDIPLPSSLYKTMTETKVMLLCHFTYLLYLHAVYVIAVTGRFV